MDNVKLGATGTAEMIVGTNDTALRVGSGKIAVLATPVMINLIEEAALDALEAALPDGKQSLGTHLDVSHIAATPTGMKVVATARIVGIDNRTIDFEIEVEDEIEVIGKGRHTRVVVSAARFQDRVDAKAQKKA